MVSVTCITSSRSPTANYAWMKNGVTLNEKTMRDNIRITNTEDVSVLILDPVHLSDDGNYSCSATNSFGKDQHTAHLNVKAPPHWLSLPSDVVTTLGETTVVECSASGSPEPLVKFKKHSGNRVFEEESLGGKNVLRLKAASYEQSGNYQCEADNGIFPAILANFTILIRCKDINNVKTTYYFLHIITHLFHINIC
nr:neural cell adhesion molecule L1-like protein [Parasteatoda tepidariorum]